MNKKRIVFFSVIAFFLLASVLVYATSDSYRLMRARSYLTDLMFNPELGLCANSPRVAPYDYWLFNDNYLAMMVLRASHPAIANQIETTLQHYGYHHNNKVEALDGHDIPEIFHEYNITILEKNSHRILMDYMDPGANPIIDPFKYMDLCAWKGLDLLNEGNVTGAQYYWIRCSDFWNGTGFIDWSFLDPQSELEYHVYLTYKNALFLIFTERLQKYGNLDCAYLDKVRHILFMMQEDNGGFNTGYDSNFQHLGDTNTETTSLAILALDKQSQERLLTKMLWIWIPLPVILLVYIIFRKRLY